MAVLGSGLLLLAGSVALASALALGDAKRRGGIRAAARPYVVFSFVMFIMSPPERAAASLSLALGVQVAAARGWGAAYSASVFVLTAALLALACRGYLAGAAGDVLLALKYSAAYYAACAAALTAASLADHSWRVLAALFAVTSLAHASLVAAMRAALRLGGAR